jgi:DNA invertase Pin-like site-specific DNA recombinase
MLAVLVGLADVERDLIRTRTAEGRSRAKAQRQQMGRPLPLHRKRLPDAARKALRSTNSPAVTTSAYSPFAARRMSSTQLVNRASILHRLLLAVFFA